MRISGSKGLKYKRLIGYSRALGAVAQLGERVNGIHEVAGSIPVSSTSLRQKAVTPKLLRRRTFILL